MNKYLKAVFILLGVSVLSFTSVIYFNSAASFNKYAPKLLKFEGKGYGIHKPIWGDKMFSKEEALNIHRHHYWNRYLGNHFKHQEVAEVFIDHLINAGAGRNQVNVKAFETIIGAEPNGVLTVADVELANDFEHPEDIVNPYVKHRLNYYRTRKNAEKYPGWFKRARSFYMKETDTKPAVESSEKDNDDEMIIEDYIVIPNKK